MYMVLHIVAIVTLTLIVVSVLQLRTISNLRLEDYLHVVSLF